MFFSVLLVPRLVVGAVYKHLGEMMKVCMKNIYILVEEERKGDNSNKIT